MICSFEDMATRARWSIFKDLATTTNNYIFILDFRPGRSVWGADRPKLLTRLTFLCVAVSSIGHTGSNKHRDWGRTSLFHAILCVDPTHQTSEIGGSDDCGQLRQQQRGRQHDQSADQDEQKSGRNDFPGAKNQKIGGRRDVVRDQCY